MYLAGLVSFASVQQLDVNLIPRRWSQPSVSSKEKSKTSSKIKQSEIA